MGGGVVLAIIAVIGIVALVLAGSAMDKDKDTRAHRRMDKSKEQGATRSRASAAKTRAPIDAEEFLPETDGLPPIPPPDAKRIEGISPKNETPKFRRGGM